MKLFRVLSVLTVSALLLGLLVGVVAAQPLNSAPQAMAAAAPAKALLAPPAQAVTGSVQVDPGQQGDPGQGGGQTTTTTNNNFFVNLPGWVWIVLVLLIIIVVALIAGGNRGGGNTTVIKD